MGQAWDAFRYECGDLLARLAAFAFGLLGAAISFGISLWRENWNGVLLSGNVGTLVFVSLLPWHTAQVWGCCGILLLNLVVFMVAPIEIWDMLIVLPPLLVSVLGIAIPAAIRNRFAPRKNTDPEPAEE